MRYVLVILSIFLLAQPVFAHLGGDALENNNYRVELGRYPQDEIAAGEAVVFAVGMENLEGSRVFDTKAWVRISLGDTILFSSADMITDDGTVDFDFTFPKTGEYEILLRMVNLQNNDEATVTFPLTVVHSPEVASIVEQTQREVTQSRFNLAVLTLALGFIAGVIISRFRLAATNGEEKEKNA